jgi:hypothetical protein
MFVAELMVVEDGNTVYCEKSGMSKHAVAEWLVQMCGTKPVPLLQRTALLGSTSWYWV